MRLLLVEDERKTAALLSSTLMKEAFEVVCVDDGLSGLKRAMAGGFDALLVDIMMPKLDGLSLVRQLRAKRDTTPVIMLSARGEVDQRVEGLDAGADDYLPKPFAMSELMARLRSLLRRNSQQKPAVLTVADLTYDQASRETRRGGKRIELSARESLLLECLLRAEGAVVSRRDIISAVWEYDFDPGTNLVEVYVRRLRDKIDRDFTPALIQTVRGLGYALRLPIMTLRRRILLYYSITLSLSLVIVGFWSWFEFNEQRDEALHGGADAALKHDPLEETLEIILYGGLPAILLGIIGGGLLMRRALRPIEELTEVLEKTDVSNLANPVPRSGNGDELDRMTAVFNRMKERLGLSFTQAREFTLNASHELKTPLTVIHGTLEQMATNELATEVDRERAASLLEEVQRLSSIVGQLSFLARADAGLLPSAREPVALDDLVRDLAEETLILASGAEISVTLGGCRSVSVSGDKMRLRQLLLNLADNAVKYNERGGSIEMTLVRQNDAAMFTITNTGPALPADLRARVFERFFRGDLAHNSATEGSGLGLSIAKSIVEAHQGSIDYDVLPDGRTQVVVTLPALPSQR